MVGKSMHVTLMHLTVFDAVATHNNFTRAAATLGLSQPALSRTVRDLERELGVPLFDRSSRRVTLTADGRVFHAVTKRILGGYQEGIATFQNYRAGEAGVLTVAALPSVASLLLPAVIAGFLEQHPAVHVRVLDSPSKVVVEDVRHGRAEFGVTDLDRAPSDLVAEPLWVDHFVALVHAGSSLAHATSVRWAELSRMPFIVTTPAGSVRRLTDQAFVRAGTQAVNLIEATEIGTVAGMVGAGLGVSALPDSVMPMTGFANVAQVPLVDPVVARELGILRGDPATLSPAGALFVDHVRAEFTRIANRSDRAEDPVTDDGLLPLANPNARPSASLRSRK